MTNLTNLTTAQIADLYIQTRERFNETQERLSTNTNIDYTKSLETEMVSLGDILRDITMWVATERPEDFKTFGQMIKR